MEKFNHRGECGFCSNHEIENTKLVCDKCNAFYAVNERGEIKSSLISLSDGLYASAKNWFLGGIVLALPILFMSFFGKPGVTIDNNVEFFFWIMALISVPFFYNAINQSIRANNAKKESKKPYLWFRRH